MIGRNIVRAIPSAVRQFSTSDAQAARLRIGYVPEHFSTPLAFAQKHFALDAELIPYPTGTGALASSLKADADDGQIDVAIGLTEGFVSDLGKTKAAGKEAGYGLVGTYVESPLCWAISTGAGRSEMKSVGDLKGRRVGVSRIGSGSYVMSFVLADQQGWLDPAGPSRRDPFSVVPIGDFQALRRAVSDDQAADFFMWEHFTTKHFWDNGELKRIGEIYTPWPSWVITARKSVEKQRLESMTEKINRGVTRYREEAQEAVDYITSTMHYSKEDAREWMKTVRFADDVQGVDAGMVDEAVRLLRKAGVLDEASGGSEHMVTVERR